MTGAPGIRPTLRSTRWRSALLASCFIACASNGTHAYADRYNGDQTSGYLVAVDGLETHSPAEEEIPGAAWTQAARLATYLRLHHASDHRVVALYPLAAFAAATRRADPVPPSAYRYGRYASSRRAAALTDDGALHVR